MNEMTKGRAVRTSVTDPISGETFHVAVMGFGRLIMVAVYDYQGNPIPHVPRACWGAVDELKAGLKKR